MVGFALIVGGLLTLGFLRDQTMLAAAVALPIAMPLMAAGHRWRHLAGAAVIAVVVPWLSGTGPGGVELIRGRVDDLATVRSNMATDAESAFVPPVTTTTVTEPPPPVTTAPTTSVPDGGTEPPSGGPTTTVAPSVGPTIDEGLRGDLESIPRGAVAVLLRPFPWEQRGSIELRFAAMENLAWYALYALALIGLVLRWRVMRPLWYALSAATVVLAVSFVTQGNLGTAFRHRAAGAAGAGHRRRHRRGGNRVEASPVSGRDRSIDRRQAIHGPLEVEVLLREPPASRRRLRVTEQGLQLVGGARGAIG